MHPALQVVLGLCTAILAIAGALRLMRRDAREDGGEQAGIKESLRQIKADLATIKNDVKSLLQADAARGQATECARRHERLAVLDAQAGE